MITHDDSVTKTIQLKEAKLNNAHATVLKNKICFGKFGASLITLNSRVEKYRYVCDLLPASFRATLLPSGNRFHEQE